MDIKIAPGANGVGDIAFNGGEIVTDDSLQTAVYLSLYTHRGWWGDRTLGSNLYLLGREKFAPGIEKTAKGWAEEALAWLVDEGVAKTITATVERLPGGVLAIEIVIERVDNGDIERYNYNWEAQKNGVQ